ncbi:hypothetical protein [Aliiroseovarius crassostreae]|uniref:hypothetical protein n=1 Tax=Aliiroseovarius crassostreae TaxID=154981 RepID=UPI002203CB61|nr:hypothetical protein [Aliiroseovarius crassostreae]UWP89085.1 hypothetical protein K3J57_14745 [Aliiroseovarius crassostreae]
MRVLFPLLLVATPAFAEDPFPLHIKGDFTGDGVADSAEITEPEMGEGTLHLTLSNGPPVVRPNLVWIGGIGQEPWLDITPAGSLEVISQNSSIGRNRWEQTLTLAFRNGQMRVAGYSFFWRDTLNLDDIGFCDLNLLTGKGMIHLGQDENPTAIRVTTKAVPIADWPAEMPTECAERYN